ncbi:hypothetical protein [Pseudomonas sp. NPDC085632]|uniref:hypothetical protein n=1 Tax=Pseudomonas sp. NPDC085632 TaxID=3364429 RepID=UPI0037CA60E0
MDNKQPKKKISRPRRGIAIKGELKAAVDGVDRIYPASSLYIIEDFKAVSATFGVREKWGNDYISLRNGEFELVSYNLDNASIPWRSGGKLTVNYDDKSRRYFGSFEAKFNPEAYPGIPEEVTGIFEIWEEQ